MLTRSRGTWCLHGRPSRCRLSQLRRRRGPKVFGSVLELVEASKLQTLRNRKWRSNGVVDGVEGDVFGKVFLLRIR